MRARGRMVALAAATAMTLGTGVAVAHDGGGRGFGGGPFGGPGLGGGPGGFRGGGMFGAVGCDIPADQIIAVESSAQLKRLKAFLDEEVADGEMTQARANRLLQRAQRALSLQKILRTAGLTPVAKALGFASAAELETALKSKDLDEIADDKNVTDATLRTAFRDGRTASRAKYEELCGEG